MQPFARVHVAIASTMTVGARSVRRCGREARDPGQDRYPGRLTSRNSIVRQPSEAGQERLILSERHPSVHNGQSTADRAANTAAAAAAIATANTTTTANRSQSRTTNPGSTQRTSGKTRQRAARGSTKGAYRAKTTGKVHIGRYFQRVDIISGEDRSVYGF